MVSTDKFNLLHSYIFRKKNVIMDNTFSYKDKSILYICQNGTSGYANAAKGYIYDYINKKIPVKAQYFNCNDLVNENDKFHQYLNCNTNKDIEYNTIIVHSTPDIWDVVIKNAPDVKLENKLLIGRTVWEFDKLLPSWVDIINASVVDIVSVPTRWNRECFINSGVIKPIIVEPHVYIDYPYKKTGLKHLLSKSLIICKNESHLNIEKLYKFYCIGQLIERKGIIETVDAYCNTFTSNDKVVLFVKTFKFNYSKEEQQKCVDEIVNITNKYNHAPIIYIKDNLNYDEIRTLHDIGDCYVQLTKTEGFGLGIFDAFNVGKKVIVTGYGGQIEYLGKDYNGLVNYDLKSLSKNDSVFFQFKLNESYLWAEPNKTHASKLLRSSLDIKNELELINFGEGFHILENDGEQYKWMSERNEIYINDSNIEKISLDLYNEIPSNVFNVIKNDLTKTQLSIRNGRQKVEIDTKNVIKIVIESNYFIPSLNNSNSSDDRKLSCKIYNVIVNDTVLSIDKVNYINESIRNIKTSENHLLEYVGDYGEMSIRIKTNTNVGKINLGVQTSFYSHRSGWDYVIRNMGEFNNPNGVFFDGFIENAFSWRKNQYLEKNIIPYKDPWIGFLHNPPNMPLWFSDNNSYPQTLIHDEHFRESLRNCKGLYVLSDYYKRFLKHYIPSIPVNVLYHPTEIPDIKFNFDKFYKNQNKSIVNIGWWLRRLNSIFLLNGGNYQKIRLMPNNKCKDTILRLTNIERDLFGIRLTQDQINSVKIIDHLENKEYDKLLTENIVFLDLYDTSANNAVIECIARGTPLLINKHPATIEYLGEEYPFYFDSLKQASDKLNDIDLIKYTHEYLMSFDKRKQITIEYFKQQFKESEIYKSL